MNTRSTGTNHKVKIVIPLYRNRLDDDEYKSLSNNLHILNRYPILFLLPEGMTPPAVTAGYETMRVSSKWLGAQNGIAGYNRMMMSRAFYTLFADCEYILICQTDAWIFRDELDEWCGKGFDYVGAPWPRRSIYDLFFVRMWLKIRKRIFGRSGRPLRQDGFDRVGNGGLSLRRVESHILACEHYADIISEYGNHIGNLYNEDFFWATVPAEFRYPTVDEALRFSFDVHPAYCYRRTGSRLPFGCHGWSKKRYKKFWRRFIQ